MTLMDRYRRWRHGHGYGVHSPFAYLMVKEVVRPGNGYDYYGYDCINEACAAMPRDHRHRHMRRHARILLRLVARLDIRSAYLPKSSIDGPYVVSLHAANSAIELHCNGTDMNRCDLVLTAGDYIPLDRLHDFISRDGKVIGMYDVPPGWADALFDFLPHGLMLRDHNSFILINRPDMQKLMYLIRL